MIRCAASIRGFISETDGCGYDVEKLIQGLERMQRRTGKGGDTLKALKRCYDEMQQEDSRILSELRQYGSFDDGMPVYDETALEQKKEIMRKLKKMERNVEKNLGRLHKAISAAKDEERSGREDVKKSIEGDMSGFYSFDLLAQAEKRSAESKSLEWKGRLQTVLFDDILSNDIKNNARQALQMLEQIDSEDQVQNFIVLTGTPLMTRAEEERTEYRRKCDELRQTNETLCVLMGLEAREVPRDEREFALLEEENRNLCAAMLYQQEQTYISDRVNQVMREMGYDLIGKRDVQKRSGRRFHNDLYTFGDGKRSALHSLRMDRSQWNLAASTCRTDCRMRRKLYNCAMKWKPFAMILLKSKGDWQDMVLHWEHEWKCCLQTKPMRKSSIFVIMKK